MKGTITIIGLIGTALSVVATAISGWADRRETERLIDEKLDERLAEKENEEQKKQEENEE